MKRTSKMNYFQLLFLLLIQLHALANHSMDNHIRRALLFAEKGEVDSVDLQLKNALLLIDDQTTVEWINCVNRVASIYKKNDRMLALGHYQKCLELSLVTFGNNDTITAELYARIGDIYRHQSIGKYFESLQYFEKGLRIYEYHHIESKFVGFVYHFTGSTYVRIGSYEKALSHLKKAISIRLQFKDSLRAAQSYNNIGLAYADQEKYDKALTSYEKGLHLTSFNRAHQKKMLQRADLLLNKAECYISMRVESDVEALLKESLAIYEKYNDAWGKSVVYHSYGNWFQLNGDIEKALPSFQKALFWGKETYGEKHREIAKIYVDIGQHYIQKGELEKALLNFQKSLCSLIEELNDTLSYADPTPHQLYPEPWIMIALQHKATVYNKYYLATNEVGKLERSMQLYELAVKQLDVLRDSYIYEKDKEWLFSAYYDVLSGAISTTVKLGDVKNNTQYSEQAFYYLEKSKAYTLLELFKGVEATKLTGIPDSLMTMEKELRQQIERLRRILHQGESDDKLSAEINQQLVEATAHFEQFSLDLKEHYPSYYDIKFSDKENSISAIQEQLIDKDEALLEYFISDSMLYLFTILKGEFKVFHTAIDSSFSLHMEQFNKSISNVDFMTNPTQSFKAFTKNAFYLYQKLMIPAVELFEQQPDKINKLTLVPDGIMSYVPFEILISELPGKTKIDYKKLSYLINDYSIHYAYSATTLTYQKNQNSSITNNHQLISFAPVFDKQGTSNVPALAYSKQEVEQIADLLKGEYYLQEKATEENFKSKANTFNIVHLATHAILDDLEPLYSYLLFDKNSNTHEDDTLYTYELFAMNLKANLVVLSACNTGTGKLIKGEGIMSLAKGFAYAGCPAVVMSLWQVNDFSTSNLMRHFYMGLNQGLEKDQALREAKLTYLKQADAVKSHPYFWAGFVLQGDNEVLAIQQNNDKQILMWIVILLTLLFIWYLRYRRSKKKTSF